MKDTENIPIFKDLGEMIRFSQELRKKSNGELAEALLIYNPDKRMKILYKMKLADPSFVPSAVQKRNKGGLANITNRKRYFLI